MTKIEAKTQGSQVQSPSQRASNPIFNKNLGQHILKNPAIAKAIVDKAKLRSSDTVLEIGPGTGNVTMHILEQCKKTIVVEMDPRLAAELAKRVRGTPEQRKLHIVVGGMELLFVF
jgi:18S rRNA (adenine1779-N6/adenine1780-N6)-dimethyltransferase